MTLRRDMSITDVALEHPECARVLHSLGVTLCGPDERSLEAVCDAAATPSAEVYLALHRSMRERAEEWPERDWARMSSPALVGHIIERHHGYVREVAPAILHMAEHLARAHRHAEVLHHARDLFDTLAAHLDYEEQSLFPTLMMHAGGAANEAARRGLTVTHADHNEIDTAHKRLLRCAREGVAYDRCTTRRMLSRELDHFDRDLKRHSRIESEVLLARFR